MKLNDTYFNKDPIDSGYNTDAWRDFVMCQEVGHTFGLGHQDETFGNLNLGTCMDYTDNPEGGEIRGGVANEPNLIPNEHDYQLLRDIYAHLNSTSTGGGGGKGGGKKPNQSPAADGINPNDSSEWGQAVRQDSLGRNSVFERILSNGQILITHVLWTLEEEAH